MSRILLILVPSIAVPIALALLLTIVCMCRRSKQYNGQHKPIGRTAQQLEMAALANKVPIRAREFPMANIRFLQELGEGAFGKVYKGELTGYHGDNSVARVAIKTLKENAVPKMQNDFRREVDLMTDLKHPNIVCLVGVCMKEEPMCMLFEYMTHGDLHEYLMIHSPHSDLSVSDDEGTGQILDNTDMLHIATQIASGMEYLASHHFVHRDLAARNILVGDNFTVKISDFGLSRDVYSSDYYRVQSKSLLPVRWMPPESILYGKFTVESDIWSYGVVLWEIYSYGLQPYYGYSNQEVIEMIRARQILPCPEDCPSRLYSMMVECWHEVPSRRPQFKEIYARLKIWKAELLPNHNHHAMMAMSMGLVPPSVAGQSHSSGSHHSHHSGSTGPHTTMAPSMVNHINQMMPQQQHAAPIPSPLPPPPMPPMPYTQPQHIQQPHFHQQQQPQPVYTPITQSQPQTQLQQQQQQQQQQAQSQNNVAQTRAPAFQNNPALYRKPSPPGSISSQKSSSLTGPSSASPASSVSNYKPLLPQNQQPNSFVQPQQHSNYGNSNVSQANSVNNVGSHLNHTNNQYNGGLPSPTSSMNNYNKMTNSVAASAPMYIPEVRTSDI